MASNTLFVAQVLIVLLYTCNGIPGDWTRWQNYDGEPALKQQVIDLKPQVEKMTGKTFDWFNPTEYRSQRFDGINYESKVKVRNTLLEVEDRCIIVEYHSSSNGRKTEVTKVRPRC